jgi:hypothetical protein
VADALSEREVLAKGSHVPTRAVGNLKPPIAVREKQRCLPKNAVAI